VSQEGVERLERALERRLREVTTAVAPVTERELRVLAEKGEAWDRTLGGLVAASERRLGALACDRESSLVDMAAELERAERLRRERDELHTLLGALDERARSLRSTWIAQSRAALRDD
jgi:hypothetical protein